MKAKYQGNDCTRSVIVAIPDEKSGFKFVVCQRQP
jgi:hypothetical protein